MSRSEDFPDALQSAVQRLPIAVVSLDSTGSVRMMNRAAVEMFNREGISKDFVAARPSHPLSRFVSDVLAARPTTEILRFPSGEMYEVEVSERSEKKGDRLVMLLIRRCEARKATSEQVEFDRWEFTPRERDVARELVSGRSSKELAETLGISPETLKTHLARLMRKTDTSNRTELVAVLLGARREGDRRGES